MTEQELRDKIVKILEEYRDWFIEENYKRDIAKIDYTGIADALIENGIGDVSEYKKHRVFIEKIPIISDGEVFAIPEEAPKITQLYGAEEVENIVKERDEYKHRAEVAEKAAFNILNNTLQCVDCVVLKEGKCKVDKTDIANCAIKSLDIAKKQAEKELQELQEENH